MDGLTECCDKENSKKNSWRQILWQASKALDADVASYCCCCADDDDDDDDKRILGAAFAQK